MPINIAAKQNEPAEIKKLRAQRHLYAKAKAVVGLQVVLTTIIPVLGAVSLFIWPSLNADIALYGILISIIDAAVLDPWQTNIRKVAAKVQESFDCSVFDLPWDDVRVGLRPEEEDVHAASSAYSDGKSDSVLRDWYPTVVANVPLSLGRIICQRTNLRWDADLRRRYRTWLGGILLVLSLVIILVGLQTGFSIEQLVLTIVAPIAPMLLWGNREFQKHGTAADESDRLREKAGALWSTIIARQITEEELVSRSRQLQGEIYGRRVSAPMIFDWVYGRLRTAGEEQMNVAASELVNEARARGLC